jgi:hypothetical protein
MKLNIFVNTTLRRPEATANGQTFTFPEFTAGDTIKVSTRFTELIDGTRTERDLGIRSARMSLGVVDAAPTGGQWSLKVGAGASTSANTTPLMSHGISEHALAASLEALTVVTGSISPVTVTRSGGTFLIRFGATGEAPGLTVQANTLTPVSFARIRARATSGITDYELRLMQAPIATSAIPYERELPPSPTIATVQDGGTDPSGVTLWPDIQRLTIPTLFRGTFILRYGEFQRSTIIDADTTADDLSSAIDGLMAAQGYTPEVQDAGDRQFLIVFNDEASLGLDVSQLTVQVFSAPLGDPTFTLDLDTREAFDALREANPRRDCVLELEADLVPDGEDPEDLDIEAQTVTLFQVPVILRRELQWDGLSASATVEWQHPPAPRDYVPFTLDQVLTGQQQAFSAVIGDGTDTEFTLAHNLDSDLAQIVVRENSTPGRLLRPDEYAVTIEDSDSITVSFDTAPTADQYAVYAIAIGPESVFQSHTHTIRQIINLQDIIDDLGERIETLEAILPSTGPGATASSSTGLDTVIPEIREVLHYKGDADAAWSDETGLIISALPARAPYMLPAVHDGTLTDPLPDPLPAAAAGTVWVADGRTLIPGGGGVRGLYAEDNGHVASDGRLLYVASRDGTTNSYYPQAFERTLYAMAINDKMLAVNRTLQILFGVQAQLAHHSCKAQWVLSVQLGAFSAETSPATLGLNLDAVTWATPVFQQAIVLSRLAQSHFFGIRIKRLADSFTLDQQLYGVWGGNNAAAPASANFAIRARLDRFDTENKTDPRGWVAYRLIGSIETDDDGKQKTLPAKATIS